MIIWKVENAAFQIILRVSVGIYLFYRLCSDFYLTSYHIHCSIVLNYNITLFQILKGSHKEKSMTRSKMSEEQINRYEDYINSESKYGEMEVECLITLHII